MTTPASFEPDDIYCVFCHAPASGPCATCQTLICVDCCELRGGAVKTVAVCKRCVEEGRGHVGWRAWLRTLAPWLLGFSVLALVAMLIARYG